MANITGINNFQIKTSNVKPGIAQRLGVPFQKKNLKRSFGSNQTNTSPNKVAIFDARQKLNKRPLDARARLLAKKRLSEIIGQVGVQDARLKLQAKQKMKLKVNNAVKMRGQATPQNQFQAPPAQNFITSEQSVQYQQPLIITEQQPLYQQQQILYQHPQQRQQQYYQPGIYNMSGTLVKTIQTHQNMNEYATQDEYVNNSIQNTQQQNKKNMVRLKPITAPSPIPSTTSEAATNIGWNHTVTGRSSVVPQENKINVQDRIAPSSKVSFSPIQSYKVMVSNLASSVSYEDVEELFGSIGPIRRIRYSKPQMVDVFFVDRSHALASVNKYHNRELDGLPMSVVLAPNQPQVSHVSNIPDVNKLLLRKSKSSMAGVNSNVVYQALFKAPSTKDVKFTVRM